MKDNLKFILIAAGIVMVFFIMGREIIETKAKLKKTQEQIVQDKKEKAWLQDELGATKSELAKTGRDLRSYQSKLDFVNKKIFALRDNNVSLIKAKQGLENKIAFLQEEKKAMEAKLRSLSELKKAIREIKYGMKQERIKQQKEADKWKSAVGNHGFFTKDGERSYKPKVNVEVRPANVSLKK